MIDKLVSMTEFVIRCNGNKDSINDENQYFVNAVNNYAKFLKEPLTLGMFVPVDEKGNILKYSEKCSCLGSCGVLCDIDGVNREYNLAKEKVMFDGFTWNDQTMTLYIGNTPFWAGNIDGDILESALIGYDITLTKSALSKIYGQQN